MIRKNDKPKKGMKYTKEETIIAIIHIVLVVLIILVAIA
jgi:hypothetical protein